MLTKYTSVTHPEHSHEDQDIGFTILKKYIKKISKNL